VPRVYGRLRLVIIGLCLIAVGLAVFDRSAALIALAALLAVVGIVGITSWVIRGGTDTESADPPA
jgi:hypothetical protein